jgi:hypothetical protein
MQRSRRPSSSHFSAIERTSGGQSRRRREPVAQSAFERRELQEQMAARAELDVGRARDRRTWRAKVLGSSSAVQLLALVAARVGMAAVRAGPDDVAIGQEPPVGGE